jgi:putative ABC transport system ATP-binding protein
MNARPLARSRRPCSARNGTPRCRPHNSSVAIARAFATDPEIVFADEPTGNLDADTGARIIELLFELNASARTTLILVTHDDALAARCQRRLHLVAGRASEVALA